MTEKKKPGLAARMTKDRRVKASTNPVDVVARRVTLRRDRWEQVDALTRALSMERGILAAPAEVLAIVIDAGLGCVDSSGKPKPPAEATLKVSFASPSDAERNDLVETVNRLGKERDDLQAEVRRYDQALAEKTSELEAEREKVRVEVEKLKALRCDVLTDHAGCRDAFADGREEDACLACRNERSLKELSEEVAKLQKKVSELEDRPEQKELDAAEKKAEDLEQKLEDAEAEKDKAESDFAQLEEEIQESVTDLGAVARWAFGYGAAFAEVYPLAATDAGRDEIQKAWAGAVPAMPQECFPFKGGKP